MSIIPHRIIANKSNFEVNVPNSFKNNQYVQVRLLQVGCGIRPTFYNGDYYLTCDQFSYNQTINLTTAQQKIIWNLSAAVTQNTRQYDIFLPYLEKYSFKVVDVYGNEVTDSNFLIILEMI